MSILLILNDISKYYKKYTRTMTMIQTVHYNRSLDNAN